VGASATVYPGPQVASCVFENIWVFSPLQSSSESAVPKGCSDHVKAAVSTFLWRGHLEQSAWDELYSLPSQGDLVLTFVSAL
jgi:hypothetical protein